MQPGLDHRELLHEAARLLATLGAHSAPLIELESFLLTIGADFHGASALATEWEQQADDLSQAFSVTVERVRWMAAMVRTGIAAMASPDDTPLRTLDELRAWYIGTIGYDPVLDDPSTILQDVQTVRREYIAGLRGPQNNAK